ncbi:glycoside hydrolase family 79 protein [Schizophyllum commune Loenen D]|nr:glycoside hydrolase family 79 protein [Schizophyllum commune Loenen D]
MSVINQVIGRNSTHLQPPFLNLMQTLVERGGPVRIRLGGNTQEFAFMVDDLGDGKAVSKQKAETNNPTETPAVIYTMDLFYLLANVSSLVDVRWVLGVPFNDTDWRLEIAQHGTQVLGDKLLALQVGNEPDLYAAHGHRPDTYTPATYSDEFASCSDALDAAGVRTQNYLIGPSVATGDWRPEDVWDTGFLDRHRDRLGILAVEHYPDNNCFAMFGANGSPKVNQDEFPLFLNHTAPVSLIQPYLNSSTIARDRGLPFYMLETNTASCGGFPGISNSYGAALWALDYGFQLAYSNFSGGMLHVGGQNVFYNRIRSEPHCFQLAPPGSRSAYSEFTIGSIFYSALILSEALGSTGTAQVVDLQGNNGNIYTPQYAVYENGKLARVALFNYVTDANGGNDYTATIRADGLPGNAKVKYLQGGEGGVAAIKNFKYAGQTFGNQFEVDGILRGDLDVQTISCSDGACAIHVPAPGFALVFLADDADDTDIADKASATKTFATTAQTKTLNTATVDPSVLATANGMNGTERGWLGSTSHGSVTGGARRSRVREGGLGWAAAVVVGVSMLYVLV